MSDTIIDGVKSPDANSDTDLSFPFHYLSHADLLCFPPVQRGDIVPAVDAIIVPTIRDVEQIRPARTSCRAAWMPFGRDLLGPFCR